MKCASCGGCDFAVRGEIVCVSCGTVDGPVFEYCFEGVPRVSELSAVDARVEFELHRAEQLDKRASDETIEANTRRDWKLVWRFGRALLSSPAVIDRAWEVRNRLSDSSVVVYRPMYRSAACLFQSHLETQTPVSIQEVAAATNCNVKRLTKVWKRIVDATRSPVPTFTEAAIASIRVFCGRLDLEESVVGFALKCARLYLPGPHTSILHSPAVALALVCYAADYVPHRLVSRKVVIPTQTALCRQFFVRCSSHVSSIKSAVHQVINSRLNFNGS